MAETKKTPAKTAEKKPVAAKAPVAKKPAAKPAAKPVAKVAEKKPVAPKAVTAAPEKVETPKVTPVKKPEVKKVEAPVAKKPEVKKVAPQKEAKIKTDKPKLPYVSNGEITVELVKSTNGCTVKQIRTVQALGLRKINDKRAHKDNSVIRGMCNLVAHLVKVEKI